jgi:hypothetical protein
MHTYMLVDHDGVCKGCTLSKNAKGIFPKSENRSKGIMNIINSDVCGQMMVPHIYKFLLCHFY